MCEMMIDRDGSGAGDVCIEIEIYCSPEVYIYSDDKVCKIAARKCIYIAMTECAKLQPGSEIGGG